MEHVNLAKAFHCSAKAMTGQTGKKGFCKYYVTAQQDNKMEVLLETGHNAILLTLPVVTLDTTVFFMSSVLAHWLSWKRGDIM